MLRDCNSQAKLCIGANRARPRQQQTRLCMLQGGKTLLNGVPPEQLGVPKWRTQVQLHRGLPV